MRFALPSLLILPLVACAKPPPATPEAAYIGFIKDVARARQGEEVQLLEDFDTATRSALTARAAAASQATGNHIPADPIIQLLQAPPPELPIAIKVVEQAGERATLQVDVDAGVSGRAVMVREGGRWRVHLDLDPPS